MSINKKLKIIVIGLGYVGLPLSIEFGKKREVIGFDINKQRIKELNQGIDHTREIKSIQFKKAKKLTFTFKENEIRTKDKTIFIITTPTPIDKNKRPDLSFLKKACQTVGRYLKYNDVVVFESTVFPGCTEDFCVPILQKVSKLKFNKDFFCGYSPERINPGDKSHKINNTIKVVSGSNPKITKLLKSLYSEIVNAGVYLAPSIKVAEAAKVIENTQRDLNVAFINELSIIFNKLGIDTEDVLKTASTKWNFQSFKPGLVGGHCIGVDPYYLTHKAKSLGYNPNIILSGRMLNDSMAKYVSRTFIKAMKQKLIKVDKSNVLIMGLSFKENCPDTRNSKVFDLIKILKKNSIKTHIYDPWVDKKVVKKKFDIDVIKNLNKKKFDGIIITVAHDEFKNNIDKIKKLLKTNSIIYDLKHIYPRSDVDLRL